MKNRENVVINIEDHDENFINPFEISTLELPNNTSLFSCEYRLANYHTKLFEQFNIDCPSSIYNAVLKRQAEFLAGRYAAKYSLASLAEKKEAKTDVKNDARNDAKIDNIPIGELRNPIWPDGISASITHTNNKAICVSAYTADFKFVGIDIENRLALESITDIKNSIINTAESDYLDTVQLSYEDAFTLVFSAKESLFKALFPSVGCYFDFRAAQVIEISPSKRRFKVQLLEQLSPRLLIGKVFTGQFIFSEQYVFTQIIQ